MAESDMQFNDKGQRISARKAKVTGKKVRAIKPKDTALKMIQIVTGHFVNTFNGGESYSVIGLTKDGRVYRYDVARNGWVAWVMKEIPARQKP